MSFAKRPDIKKIMERKGLIAPPSSLREHAASLEIAPRVSGVALAITPKSADGSMPLASRSLTAAHKAVENALAFFAGNKLIKTAPAASLTKTK